MSVRLWLFAGIVLGTAAAAGYAYFTRPPVAQLFGGREGLAIVSRPSKVEAFRLQPPEDIDLEDATPFDYSIVHGPVQVSASAARDASAALQSADSYGWSYVKGCGAPVYGARLSFYRGQKRVDIYLCFLCDFLSVCRDGEVVGREDFDPAREALLGVIKESFPDDPDIKSLK